MPLLVSMPGTIPQGKVDDTTVITAMDFLPTLFSIIGAKNTGKTDGQDMSATWQGAGRARKEPLFWRWRWEMPPQLYHWSPALAMRQGNWKLLMNLDKSRIELYNLATDPTELDNLLQENPQVAANMQKALLEWNKSLPEAKFQASAGKNNYNWPGNK